MDELVRFDVVKVADFFKSLRWFASYLEIVEGGVGSDEVFFKFS